VLISGNFIYFYKHLMSPLSKYIDQLNSEFLTVFTRKEDSFWQSKMGLSNDPTKSQQQTSEAEIAVNRFIQDSTKLIQLRELAKSVAASPEETVAVGGWEKFFEANAIEDEKAKQLSELIVALEGELLVARGGMDLGYTDPHTGEFHKATTNELTNIKRVNSDEAVRKAAFEGLVSIGPFVMSKFIEVVRKRNELGRLCGYEDYYDWKVSRTEGLSKKELFALLDDLELRTRESAKQAIEQLVKEKGDQARRGWNYEYLRSGDILKEFDPYLPFSEGLERWVRSFAALGIRYRGANLTLDLIDRKGKYENGFMHGPSPAWIEHGKWHSARINFTANAIPNKVGSGEEALNTLFHEGGHAAHFSNVQMNAPCFAQEFAPTSVAYAETQSMFCDSILSDADWLSRYAKNTNGESIPFELIERKLRQTQPFEVISIRAMLGVCYFEKALYELSDAELTAENIYRIAQETEHNMYFMEEAPRPILAVPHILAGESSAYYHGYVLAEMAVHQTRQYFLDKYGYITDNPKVGPELEEGYWKAGNSVSFMDLVKHTTGKPFNADAMVDHANTSADDAIKHAKEKIEKSKSLPAYSGTNDLDADIRVMHGNELICEFSTEAEFPTANTIFKNWVTEHYPKK
jgi:hypothetical protein